MLQSPSFSKLNLDAQIILGADCSNKSLSPIEIQPGVYEVEHFCFDCMLTEEWDTLPQMDSFSCYGTCDSIEQFMVSTVGQYIVHEPTRIFCVGFVHVSKAEQPSEHGWRWNKYGPYIGTGQPTADYLYREPGFDNGVYVYHVCEKMDF